MPIYEFKCTACGEKFEKLVFPHTQHIMCPVCESSTVEKLFSRFGFKSGGKFSSSSSSGCSSCTATNCATCH